jgi:hypothetical protein
MAMGEEHQRRGRQGCDAEKLDGGVCCEKGVAVVRETR